MKLRYIRLIRPLGWLPYLSPFAVGFALGITSSSNLFHVIFSFIAFCCCGSFCFTINAITDKDTDRFHDGKSKDINLTYQPIVTGEITEKQALILSMIFLFFSLFFAWLINILFFLLTLIINAFGCMYSMPPTRLKAKPIGDILCNTIVGGIIFLAGLSIGGKNMIPLLIMVAFLSPPVYYIPTVITDYKFDKKAKLKTSAIFYGPKKILRVIYPLSALVILIYLILFLSYNLEIKVISLQVIISILSVVLLSNIKLKEKRMSIHKNWMFIPLALKSTVFIVYGILKLVGLIII